jgi:hypothetical protein
LLSNVTLGTDQVREKFLGNIPELAGSLLESVSPESVYKGISGRKCPLGHIELVT